MRTFIRGLGEVMITVGLILLLFVGYQLFWTNFLAARAANAQVSDIKSNWKSDPGAPELTQQPVPGQGFALMTIPRLGDDVKSAPVIQGVDLDVLAEGIGHYIGTAMPGQVGNFAVAGHRATHGEPFRFIDTLQVGDHVYVETDSYWYTYRLARQRIVPPTDTWVIKPQPFDTDPLPSNRLITLTTCNPRWASYERWIWWGELVAKQDKSKGTPTMTVNG